MLQTKRAIFSLWWTVNGLLLLGILAESLHIASTSEGSAFFDGLVPPDISPPLPFERVLKSRGTELLRDLPNPLKAPKESASKSSSKHSRLSEIALLHGIDQVKGNESSATAYLYLPSLKIQANAYFGEVIRDSATGLEITELAGWKLAGLIPGGAVFRNGASEETLRIGASPWSESGGFSGESGVASTTVGRAPQVMRQWAISANASTEWVVENGARQVCGPPDTLQPGDHPTAWAPKEQNAGEQWIELTYSLSVRPVGVRIHENCNPGSVIRLEALSAGGRWEVLWQGTDPTKGQQIAWFEVPFEAPPFSTRTIRITLDTAGVPGWNELDAVELIGKPAR